jgi:hypothetical protein
MKFYSLLGRKAISIIGKCVDASEAARRRVYEQSHEFESDKDKEGKGNALIIDLDGVDGFFVGAQFKMRR